MHGATIDTMEAQEHTGKLSIAYLYDTLYMQYHKQCTAKLEADIHVHRSTLKLKFLGCVLLVSSQSEAVSTAD